MGGSNKNKAITEFYASQQRFHDDMTRLVSFLENLQPPEMLGKAAKEEFESALKEFIAPYKVLAVNHFGKQPKTDKEGIKRITRMLGRYSDDLQQAYVQANNNIRAFQNFLSTYYTADEQLRMDSPEGKKSVSNEIIKPTQNNVRYELTVREIDKRNTVPALAQPIADLYSATKKFSASAEAQIKQPTKNVKAGASERVEKELTDLRLESRTKGPESHKSILGANGLFTNPNRTAQLREIHKKGALNDEMRQFKEEQKSKGPRP